MKKLIMTLLLATVNMTCFCQLGYRYGDSFIKLTPDTLCFFVQTKTKERMNFLKNNSSEKQRKGKFIAELSENACIMDSKPTEGDDYVSEIFKDEKKRKIIILPRLAIKMKKGYDVREIIAHKGSVPLCLELKPGNKNGVFRGYKQLERYKSIFEKERPGTKWNTILELY